MKLATIRKPAVLREAAKTKSGEVVGTHASERIVEPSAVVGDSEPFFTKGITIGYTKNLGDYESLRVSVSLQESFPVGTKPEEATEKMAQKVFADLSWLLKRAGVPAQFSDVPNAVRTVFQR